MASTTTVFATSAAVAPYDGPLQPRFSYPSGPVALVFENTNNVTMDWVNAGPPSPVPNVYTITGGADAALFTVDPANGLLSFIQAPDYESPLDRGAGVGNNTFQVEVTRQAWAGTASQLLTIRVADVDERPGTAPVITVDDRREVTVRTVTDSDGTPRQLLSIATRASPDAPVYSGSYDGIAIVRAADGSALLQADRLDGVGLHAAGSVAPQAAAATSAAMVREIRAHSDAGSAAQAGLVDGATAWLAGLAPGAQVLLQTITPELDFGQGVGTGPQMVLSSSAQDANNPLTALVIDTRGLWRSSVDLDHIDFVAISGDITIGPTASNGLGNQFVVADDAVQTLNTGAGDDVVHAGGGNDVINGGVGNDRLHGDAGDDRIVGGAGNDWIDGGAGTDTVRLAGTRADYTIRVEQGSVSVTARNGEDGSDGVANVELLNFGGAGVDLSVRGTLARMVAALEDRVATRVELDALAAQHAAGASLPEISAGLLARSTVDDSMTHDDFVRALFEQGADRPADLQELNTWLSGLAAGTETRAAVLLRFADSAVMQQHDAWYGATMHIADTEIGSLVRLYDALFDRAPDQAGLNYWLAALENGLSLGAIAAAFTGAGEGQFGTMTNAQFVAHLYGAGLERTAGQDELAWWTQQIDSGAASRGEVLLGIAESPEMVELVGVLSTSLALSG